MMQNRLQELIKVLEAKGCCQEYIDEVRKKFPDGEFTLEGCVHAAELNPPFDYAAHALFSEESLTAYLRTVALEWKRNSAELLPLWIAYDNAREEAWKTYIDAVVAMRIKHAEAKASVFYDLWLRESETKIEYHHCGDCCTTGHHWIEDGCNYFDYNCRDCSAVGETCDGCDGTGVNPGYTAGEQRCEECGGTGVRLVGRFKPHTGR